MTPAERDAVFTRHYRRLVGVAVSVCLNEGVTEHDIEGVCADALANFWRLGLPKWEPGRGSIARFFAVGVRWSVAEWRRQNARKSIEMLAPAQWRDNADDDGNGQLVNDLAPVGEPEAPTLDVVRFVFLRSVLVPALGRLGRRDRGHLQDVVDGVPVAKTAKRLRIHDSNVTRRRQRALATFLAEVAA